MTGKWCFYLVIIPFVAGKDKAAEQDALNK